jgi:hypothetical protein
MLAHVSRPGGRAGVVAGACPRAAVVWAGLALASLLLVLPLLSGCGSSRRAEATGLRMNQVQVLGTHNSYHVQPAADVMAKLAELVPPLARALAYSHAPLEEQLRAHGIRQLEIDVFADPAGGLFANRAGLRALGRSTASGIPELREPGFKVLHVQDIDFLSNCWTFVQCLQAVRRWSEANPGHVPLVILVEAKDDPIPDPLGLGFVVPRAIGRPELDALDREILSVFPRERVITPDDVRGGWETLEEAVLNDSWPALDSVRGKVLFALDNASKRRHYLAGHPSLRGRVMFTNARPGQPDAAFVTVDDPVGNEERIAELVQNGYLVRTRADADTEEARSGATARRDAAMASGAQLVSTDYPAADPALGTGYAVAFPEGRSLRCNPVNAPPTCEDRALEGELLTAGG